MHSPSWPPGTLWLIAGPTAVGKSEVALELAERVEGEIVSVDSMQVYCGMDIGTAKPTAVDRQRIPHHLIDVLYLNETFSAAQFVQLATRAVEQIRVRSHIPILCGGTGLYVKAWLEGLGTAPPANPDVRSSLEKTPLPLLQEELARLDPATYESIDRHNPRRVIRALEVLRLTGRPFSQQRALWQGCPGGLSRPEPLGFWGLYRTALDLHQRIDRRVDQMFQQGLVEETRRLLQAGLEQNPTAQQSIGYRQVLEYLRGQRNLEDTIQLVKRRTRQFAKRQMTWFRNQMSLRWLEITPEEAVGSVVDRLISASAPATNGDFSQP